ncbi:MAG: pH regulation protein F [Gemmatimonas sp.]|nr:pH regulation protein F [Gemmatimonas sp.]
MSQLFLGVALLLVLLLVGGLARVLQGPTPHDRLLAAQLFGTTAIAILLLLAESSGAAGVLDVALVLSLLAMVSVVAFISCSRGRGAPE